MIHVLIIEDDPKIADLHLLFLKKMPVFQVVGVVTTIEEAKEWLAVTTPDLLLLDVYLPDGKGTDLLWYVRENYKEMDVIMVTAAKEVEPISEAMRGGAYDYILKPILFPRFQQTLEGYYAMKQKEASPADIDQTVVDEWFSRSFQRAATVTAPKKDYPKGIDQLTLTKIERILSEKRETTADALAVEIGASRTTARRYLEYFILLQQVEAALDYGTVGRPQRKYRWIGQS